MDNKGFLYTDLHHQCCHNVDTPIQFEVATHFGVTHIVVLRNILAINRNNITTDVAHTTLQSVSVNRP